MHFCHFRMFFSSYAKESFFQNARIIFALFERHVTRDLSQASFVCPGKVGHPYQVHFGERLYEKQVDRPSQVNNVRAWSDCRHRVEPAGLLSQSVCLVKNWSYQESDPTVEKGVTRLGLVTNLAEPTFCFSFATFCKEMYEKLVRPGQLKQADGPQLLPRKLFSL